MRFAALDIPDSPAELATWLERQIVGIELADVVAGLVAVRGDDRSDRSLNAICGEDLKEVLQSGLSSLSASQLREVLQNPRSLYELQERVFLEGGTYWQGVPRTSEHQSLVQSGWQAIESQLPGFVPPGEPQVEPHRPRAAINRRWIYLSLASAASLLIVSLTWWATRPTTHATWGWDRPGVFAVKLPPSDYLRHLAETEQEWFKKRPESAASFSLPESAASLSQRLVELRQGCDALLSASHPQLAEVDRQWLRERCRAWSGKIDQHLADLKQGANVATVRSDADETVEKLIAALRARASEIEDRQQDV